MFMMGRLNIAAMSGLCKAVYAFSVIQNPKDDSWTNRKTYPKVHIKSQGALKIQNNWKQQQPKQQNTKLEDSHFLILKVQ